MTIDVEVLCLHGFQTNRRVELIGDQRARGCGSAGQPDRSAGGHRGRAEAPAYSCYRGDDGFGQETALTLTRMEVPLWTM
jgi:hypothetical protein